MSYNKTLWKTGDLISSIKLNNMEDGIATERVTIIQISQITDTDPNTDNYFEMDNNITPRVFLNIFQNGNLPIFKINYSGELYFSISSTYNIMFYDGHYILTIDDTYQNRKLRFSCNNLDEAFGEASIEALYTITNII